MNVVLYFNTEIDNTISFSLFLIFNANTGGAATHNSSLAQRKGLSVHKCRRGRRVVCGSANDFDTKIGVIVAMKDRKERRSDIEVAAAS